MPSFPLEFTTTWVPVTGTPEIPAIKVAIWVALLPMRIVLDSPATPTLPKSMLLLPVVRFAPALLPTAMLNEPVLFASASKPLAVLLLPFELPMSAQKQLAVLLEPVVLPWSALTPLAVLLLPVVLFPSA